MCPGAPPQSSGGVALAPSTHSGSGPSGIGRRRPFDPDAVLAVVAEAVSTIDLAAHPARRRRKTTTRPQKGLSADTVHQRGQTIEALPAVSVAGGGLHACAGSQANRSRTVGRALATAVSPMPERRASGSPCSFTRAPFSAISIHAFGSWCPPARRHVRLNHPYAVLHVHGQ
jgi:hypothetical protein